MCVGLRVTFRNLCIYLVSAPGSLHAFHIDSAERALVIKAECSGRLKVNQRAGLLFVSGSPRIQYNALLASLCVG